MKDFLTELESIHSALDAGLGDTDVDWIEDDEELRTEYPIQWAASQLAEVIIAMKAVAAKPAHNSAMVQCRSHMYPGPCQLDSHMLCRELPCRIERAATIKEFLC